MRTGFVYEAPRSDYPILAVVFDEDGQVVRAEPVDSVKEGHRFIADFLAELRELDKAIRPV